MLVSMEERVWEVEDTASITVVADVATASGIMLCDCCVLMLLVKKSLTNLLFG